MKKVLCFTAMVILLSMGALQAHAAADYPTRAITAVVNFGPGGIGDTTARILAEPLQRELGQPIVIVNRGGGATIPGFSSALRADPDGYTVAAGSPGSAIIATIFTDAPRFDLDAMVYVGAYMFQDRIVMVKADKPYKTWQEFVAFAKANPGKLSFGSGGAQEAMEAFRAATIKDGLDLKFVMYKGGAEAATDLLGGHIDVIEAGVGSPAYQAARKGEVNILVNLGYTKIPHFEKIPSLLDLGYPYPAGVVYGFIFPDKTPEAIRARWEKALEKVLQDKDVIDKMANIGLNVQFVKGADYKEFCKKVVTDMNSLLEYNKQAKK